MAKTKNDTFVKPSDLSQKKVKRMKKKKDLEKMRKNILAAKRQMKQNNKQEKVVKSSFVKTLNNFADIRQKNEDETQGFADKGVKKRTICSRLLPEPSVGIFKNGAMGKEAQRTAKVPYSKQNEARLRGDLFKLLNGEKIPSSNKQVTETDEMKGGSSGSSTVTAMKSDDKNTNNSASTSDKSKDKSKKTNKELKNTKTVDQSNQTKRLFDDDNEEDMNLDNIPMNPLHFSPRARESKRQTENRQTDDGVDETDGDKSEFWSDPDAVKLYEELRDKVEEYFDVDFSNINMQDPILEIKSRLANVYERTHGKRSASSNNNDTCPFPSASTSQSHSSWSAEAQACSGTTDNNSFEPLNPFTKSRPTPHDYETVEARIINALGSLPTGPELEDPFFNVTSPQDSVSLSPVSSGTIILSNHGNVDKTTTEDFNSSVTRRSEAEDPACSFASVSSLPAGWDANAENEWNLIHRNLKHVPIVPRRTQPRETLFDVPAQVPKAQAHPKVTLIQEQVKPSAAQAHRYLEPRVTQTQATHPLQTEAWRKINIPNNHETFPREFFPPILPTDKSRYPGTLDKELPYYPTPSIVTHQLDNDKNKNSKSKGNFMIPELQAKYINPNPYCEIMKPTKDGWNNQFVPIVPGPPPHLLTRTADAETNSRYPFTFSSNDFLKSRTGIPKDDYLRFNGEKRELNETATCIPGTKPLGMEPRNLNCHKQFNHPRDLNAKSFKLFPKFNQFGDHQLHPQTLQKHQMYEPVRDNYFVKNEPKMPGNLGYDMDPRSRLSFLSADNDNYKLQEHGISDMVLENLKVLSFQEDQLFIDKGNNNYNDNSRYCHQEQMGKYSQNLSQPSKYLAMMNEHQSYPRAPQRVPIYFNEPSSNPLDSNINAGYHGAVNTQNYQPQDVQRKQIQAGIPIAVFAAKDRNPFAIGSNYPDKRNVFKDKIIEGDKNNCKSVRFNEDTRLMKTGAQMQFDPRERNQGRKITLPNGQVGLFFPQDYSSSDGSRDDGFLNINHYPDYR